MAKDLHAKIERLVELYRIQEATPKKQQEVEKEAQDIVVSVATDLCVSLSTIADSLKRMADAAENK